MLFYFDVYRADVSLRAVVMKDQIVCAAHDLAAIYGGVNFVADLPFDALADDFIESFFYQKYAVYDNKKRRQSTCISVYLDVGEVRKRSRSKDHTRYDRIAQSRLAGGSGRDRFGLFADLFAVKAERKFDEYRAKQKRQKRHRKACRLRREDIFNRSF